VTRLGAAREGWVRLAASLREDGRLTADWAEVFAEVDRAGFLPAVMWPHDMSSRTNTTVDRTGDPDAWYAYADADVPVTTQWDDGHHQGTAPGQVPTSSASAPSVVASMLADLDVAEGMRVLEIGTGTGWTAGLLTRRLGQGRVTSIEVDPAVAAAARTALHGASLHPELVVGDGLPGHPPGAPYDRILATMGVRTVPFTWVQQTAPGGVIVAPWGTPYANADALVRLTVTEDHDRAEGRFTRAVEFMKARTQRHPPAPHSTYVPGTSVAEAADTTTTTSLSPADLLGLGNPFAFVAGLLVPGCASASERRGNAVSMWLYGIGDRSWAAAILHDNKPSATVYQGGPRRLWDTLEAAHHWWTTTGRPGITRFGLTITPHRNTPWLDTPDRPLPPTAPQPQHCP
jgi:protein-L-isoaspartate O-methyltransferase